MTADPGDATVVQKSNFLPGGRMVPAERGWSWLAGGWGLFRKAPGTWIGMIVVLFVIFVVLAVIPFVGAIATSVLMPVFTAGLVLACRKIDQGGEPQFSDLFAGFQNRFGVLVSVGLISLAAQVAILLVAALATGAGVLSLLAGTADLRAVGTTLILAALVVLALMVPLLMAIWFAPPLILFHERSALDSIKGSFSGCLRNVVPFLVYGVAGLLLAIVATIPLGLGWLVLGPVIAASVYTAYRDIFIAA